MPTKDDCIYSEHDSRKMAKALDPDSEELPEGIRDQIVAAAEGYRWAARYDTFFLRTQKRQLLKLIRRQGKKLEASLRELDQETGILLDANILPDDLGVLQLRARKALKTIPKSSHTPYRARRSFVEDLARIFKVATGDEPKRRYDLAKGGEYGPFHDFVLAALEPIAPHETSGVDGDIKAVLKKQKKSAI